MHNQKIYWNSFEVAKVAFRRTTTFNRTILQRSAYYEINFAERKKPTVFVAHIKCAM